MATLLKDHKWFKENAIDIDFIKAHEHFEPQGTRHVPISSALVLDKFRQKATDYGLVLSTEKGALSKDGKRYNYVATIARDGDDGNDFALEVGFQNYNDCTRSFRGLMGSAVFLCSNGCIHGIVEDATARHTRGNMGDIDRRIDVVLTKFIEQRPMIFGQMKLLKETKLDDALLGQFILNLTRTKRFGNTKVLDVVRYIDDPTAMIVSELETPTLNKKSDDSAFRLLNACTYITTHKIENEAVKHELSKVMLDTLMTTIQGKDYQPIGDAIEVQAEAVAA